MTFDGRRKDALTAAAFALLLAACWVARDWAQLRWLNLPDTDDMMRLAQVRDWLAGQGFADWTQYRLAPPGAPMHWSRLNDLLPAALILTARPLLGQSNAELMAVIVAPTLLFALYLTLSARMARRIGPPAGALPAIVIAALAYPANALFLPGRIDHHALQVVLLQIALLAMMRRGGWRSGAVVGAMVALSFGIGLETAPQLAALVGAFFLLWLVRGKEERARAIGFGAILTVATLALLLFARPSYWSAEWCDAFTPASVTGAAAVGVAWLVLGALTPALRDWRLRFAVGAGLGAVALAATLASYPVCLTGPYGPMGSFLQHAIIDSIPEAIGIFEQPKVSAAIQAAALLTIALTVFAFRLRRADAAQRLVMLPLGAVYLASAVILLFQLRGAYMGSAVAAPMLAQLVLAARAHAPRWRPFALVGAWCVSAGVLWLVVTGWIEEQLRPRIAAATEQAESCKQGDIWHRLNAYPAGTVMTAMDHGARVIGGTHHGSVGAGYHRNNRGNLATYRFFFAAPEQARAIAAEWQVRYILFCPGDFSEVGVPHARPGSLAAQLSRGEPPTWAEPLPLHDTGLRFYRIR